MNEKRRAFERNGNLDAPDTKSKVQVAIKEMIAHNEGGIRGREEVARV